MDYVIDNMEEEHTKGLYYHVDDDVVLGVDNSTNEAWTEEFDHVVKCKAWLKRYDLDIEKPQILIEWSEVSELGINTRMDFAEGNVYMEKMEEKYKDDSRYYETCYSIIFPESDKSKLEVVSMDRLDIGDGEFLNPYHQVRKEGNLMERQQVMLDDAVYGRLLESESKVIDGRKNVKTKSVKIEMEMN